MRTITISTDVYSKIWADRKEGEETEDAILRRRFGCSPANDVTTGKGYFDPKFGVTFPEGFKIHKRYMGVLYEAEVRGGRWYLLNDNTYHDTLHKLTQAVYKNNANAWKFWRYMEGKAEKEITALRDKSKIARRA